MPARPKTQPKADRPAKKAAPEPAEKSTTKAAAKSAAKGAAKGAPKGTGKADAPAKAKAAKAAKPAKAEGAKAEAPAKPAKKESIEHKREVEAAEHAHQDPRGGAPGIQPAAGHRNVRAENYDTFKQRRVGRLNVMINWFRRGARPKQ